MNKLLRIGFLSLLALFQGCIYYGDGARSGDVTFYWTFWGDSCADAGVESVKITIAGEPLEDNGYYPCLNAGAPGITLHDFRPGTYSYTIEGLDDFDDV